MKVRDAFYLAFKNFGAFLSRSILALLALTLLSSAILFLGNLSFLFRESYKSSIIDSTEKYGAEVDLSIERTRRSNLKTEEISEFLEVCRDTWNFNAFYFNSIDNNLAFQDLNGEEFDGIAANAVMTETKILSGRQWTLEDEKGEGIWLAESASAALNAEAGDTVILLFEGNPVPFAVMGVTDSKQSFVSYKYLNIDRVTAYGAPGEYKFSDIRKIAKLKMNTPNGTMLSGNTVMEYGDYLILTGIVSGACAFLALLCVLASIGSLINTLRIVAGESKDKLVLMKTLGMRDGKLFLYLFLQIEFIAAVAVLISVAVVTPISVLTADGQIGTLFGLLNISGNAATMNIGIMAALPIVVFAALSAIILIGAGKSLKKIIKNMPLRLSKGDADEK